MKQTSPIFWIAAGLFLLWTGLAGSFCAHTRVSRANIVLIVIDTLRADHLPFYGYAENTSPFLSGLAEGGAVFDRAYATSSWTAPATSSIHTSLYPVQDSMFTGFRAARVRQKRGARVRLNAIPTKVKTLAEVLAGAGYHTYGVSDNINISKYEGFDQGFERFWSSNDAGAKTITARLREWAGTIEDREPYFLYLHYMDPHRPYHRNRPWYQAQADSVADEIAAYDSEINYVDQQIAEAYRLFGWDRNTLLIVTADHGEEFQDHGGWDHGRTLYGEVIDVPLLICSSADSLFHGRFKEQVSSLDILPTLREYAGLPRSTGDQGISLLPALRGREPLPTGREFFADLRSAPWFGNRVLKSVITGKYKLILTLPDREELFDLSRDPREQHDLATAREQQAANLCATISDTEVEWKTYRQQWQLVDLNREQVEKLRSLGYIN